MKQRKSSENVADLPIRSNRSANGKALPLALRELADLLADLALGELKENRPPHARGKGSENAK